MFKTSFSFCHLSVKQIAFLSFSPLFPCVNISNGVGFLRSKEHISENIHESEG